MSAADAPLPNESSGPGYTVLEGADPHVLRRRELLRLYPEIAALRRPSLVGLVPLLLLVVTHFGVGILVADATAWVIVATAWFVGAVLAFDLLVMIHELSHRTITRNRTLAQLAGGLASLPLVVPFSPAFLREHGRHHRFVGDYARDANIPRLWEARLASAGAPGKLLWFVVLPFAYAMRTAQTLRAATPARSAEPRRRARLRDWPTALLLVVQAGVLAVVGSTAGIGALAYLLASIYFALGPHPLAMRLVQEHGQQQPGALTSSYYGGLNRLIFNLGYHVEHHDFPNMPWHRLPQLRRIAPQWYPGPAAYRSRVRGFFGFIAARRLDLWDRCVRRP